MLFPTVTYAVFFMLVWPATWLLAKWPASRKTFLVAASWFFYGYWDRRFVALLAATIVWNFAIARAIAASRRPAVTRLVVGVGISGHLAVLGWFKYYGFFASSLTGAMARLGLPVHPHLVQVALPVGLSFFTFQAISYLIEVRRETISPASLLDVAAWLSFFPTLIAGPITRASELIPQLRERPDARRVEATQAFWLIARGLFKKVVLASFFASAIVDDVFASPARHSSLEILVAVYAFAGQLYADFSGYTDIAIGSALLLGFRLPENFNAPYKATSVNDFWNRWHITLSRWLRDFLFTPLARHSRTTTAATCRNLIIVMVIAGLWHGAAWTFIAFGAVHGIALARERWVRQRRRRAGRPAPVDSFWRRGARQLVTFHVVCLGWVFFRAESLADAGHLLSRLATGWGSSPSVTPLLVLTLAAVLAAQHLPPDLAARGRAILAATPVPALTVGLAGALMIIDVLGPAGVPPFLYFRF